MFIRCFAVAALIFLSGCAGLHHENGRFAATGTSINILFFQLPDDPMTLAESKVPEEATVTNVVASPNDWHTVVGFFYRFFGVGWAQIGGSTK